MIIHLWSRILSLQEVFLVPFFSVKTELLTPIRDCSVNIELNYWSMIRNKSSVFEASELKCLVSPGILLFQNSTTQSTDTLEHCMTVCLGIFAYSLTSSGFEKQIPSFPCLVQSMSLNIDMKTIRPVNSSGFMFRSCKLFWISWRICNDVNPGKYSTRIQLGHLEFFHLLTFPTFSCTFAIIPFPRTQYGIGVDKYFCPCPLDHLIMRRYWSRPVWRGAVTGFLSWRIDNSSILACLARSVISQQGLLNLQFLGKILPDFLGRAYFPLLHQDYFSLFEPDQPIDSPVVAVIVGTRTPDWSHKEQYLNFSFPNVWPPRLPQLRKVFAEQFLLGRSIQLSFKDFVEILPVSQCLNNILVSMSPPLWHRLEKTWNNCLTIHIRTSFLDASTTCNRIIIRQQLREASP